MKVLPELEHRQLSFECLTSLRNGDHRRAVHETSRDGVTFKRWGEAFLRPGRGAPWHLELRPNSTLRWHIVETKSSLTGAPNELSLYASESYWTTVARRWRAILVATVARRWKKPRSGERSYIRRDGGRSIVATVARRWRRSTLWRA